MRRHARLSAVLGGLLVCAVSPARAASPAEVARAKSAFKSAQRAYDAGDFVQALDGYGRAYDADPLPAFLFNMAQCYRQLGDEERAAEHYSRFLQMAPADSPNTRLARELLEDMRRKLALKKPSSTVTPDVPRAVTPSPTEDRPRASAPVVAVAPAPPAEPLAPLQAETVAVPAASSSIFKKWWFWTAVGAVAVTAVVIAAAPRPLPATLADVDAR